MKISILGATGKTGVQLVDQALAAGHTVNILNRRNTIVSKHANLNLFVGDPMNSNDIEKVSIGCDVIISALGQGSKKSKLITKSVRAVIEASARTNVKRFILMSSFTVKASRLGCDAKLVARMMKGMIVDKLASEDLLRNSDLEWTIVYPTFLTDRPLESGGNVVPHNKKISLSDKISRADVAAWMLNEAKENNYVKGEVIITK